MDTATVALGLFGFACAAAIGAVTYRDATRIGVSRPRLWAYATSGTISVGLVLVATAPLPGALMTAIAGPILYGFERETATEEARPVAPRSLPSGSADGEPGSDSTAVESTDDGSARTAGERKR